MLNFGASKPRVKGGARAPGAPPLDPHLLPLQLPLLNINFFPRNAEIKEGMVTMLEGS